MKINKKVIISFVVVFIGLCGWLTANAVSPEFFTSVEDTNNTLYLDADKNTFSFDISINDPDLITPGFLGILEWDENVVVIDDVFAAGRRWSVAYNDQLGDFITTFIKTGYTGKEAVVTVEGHVLTDGAVDTTIKINNFQYTDAVNLDPPDKVFYTDKNLNVVLKRIVITPTPPDYQDNPTPPPDVSVTPTPTPSNGGNGGSTGEDDNNGSSEGDNNGSSEGGNNGSSNGGNNGSLNGNNNGSSNGGKTDKTQIPSDKISQTGTGKIVAIVMGAGILASAVFYVKFNKNNY